SYSLPILGIDVPSSPGQIQDCIVIATVSGGQNLNQNPVGADNAYPTPNGTGGLPYFSTGDPSTQPSPNGSFAGQTNYTWDISVSALRSYLGGKNMIIAFNHNQTNSGSTIDQNLAIWAQVTLKNSSTGAAVYFYASSVNNGTGIQNFGVPGGDPTAFTGTQAPAATAQGAYPVGSDGSGF